LTYALAAAIGYVLGAVQFAVLVARRHGVDLRRTSDGNPGAWNALEQLGPRRAWPAFALDGAKGLVAGLVGHALGGWWVAWAGVAGAMVGHAFPLPARGRGGKSIMCFVGGTWALSPAAAAICLLLGLAAAWLRGLSWGARVVVFAFPFVQLVADPVRHVAGTGILMALSGALFFMRRSGPATSATGGAPRW
jgi:acyl phosphate:glycerol-3-phosphate acyltransferase